MNILCIGDIVGKPGRQAIEGLLPQLKEEHKLDFVIANAENAAGGSGVTARLAEDFLRMGCDVLTLGDHVWDQKEFVPYLTNSAYVIRPANFPLGVPGQGWCVKTSLGGVEVGVVNLLGRVFMRTPIDCPFQRVKMILEEIKKKAKVIIVDMHAETTSEKIAMGHFLDGQVSAVFGTHTHIQTADEKILSQGTAYITDVGMTGPYDSVIGQQKDNIIQRFITSMPVKFNVAENDIKLNAVVLRIDEKTGKAQGITRIQRALLG